VAKPKNVVEPAAAVKVAPAPEQTADTENRPLAGDPSNETPVKPVDLYDPAHVADGESPSWPGDYFTFCRPAGEVEIDDRKIVFTGKPLVTANRFLAAKLLAVADKKKIRVLCGECQTERPE
jgi:hypothetical protein